jgi:hypothetical protein
MNVESDATFRPRLRGSYRSAKGFAAAFRSRARIDNQPFAERVLRLLANDKHFCAPVFIAVPKRMSRFPRLHATADRRALRPSADADASMPSTLVE